MITFEKCWLLFIFTTVIFSCNDTFREKGKIFHAAPPDNSVSGNLYFGLYKDGTYTICNVSGIGQDCYSGDFKLDGDTLTLINLDKRVPLKSNRFLILEYKSLDSSYWKWKYKGNPNPWQRLKWGDSILSLGDVYQLDSSNNLINNENAYHFLIRLDSLKDYR